MATSSGQRVATFLLALMFLLTSIGAAGYVIWQLNHDSEGGLVQDDKPTPATDKPQTASLEGQQLGDFTGPVSVPTLKFEDSVEGTGDVVQPGDAVTIHYTGALATTGVIFDSSVDGEGTPATFSLNSLIPGWQQGIPGMKVGGKRRLFIPSALGYGEAGAGENIPPNSDLVFDIELFATER